jgi:amino acid transporter
MTNELINIDGIGMALISIADKIGITVMQMYNIYVYAQATLALVQIAMIVIWIICTFGAMVIAFKYAHKLVNDDEDVKKIQTSDRICVTLILGMVVSVLVAVILVGLYNPVIAFMCPEYTALKSLMNDVVSVAISLKK